ncbi:MAG: DUF1015 domain-containing protein [Sphingobacteriales bacterium]|jgi:uncharacterized protein (DUF1015 family)|nr:DUF1015 domain-containing protein [Sphingobacteriales bacterium]MBP9141338.1 DUF1015 domain-containing protein [Chitinophagales bacterium]MDA0198046.1 DUF1015 domain-containing protein [Bacteroidota bacterium]MBK6890724.1 DUF1015 domain-containing protein [Sphingobacteriales bacterium]MBK7526224.1 DUF1015 domain-containing protein [Sphingobacteriales bacterium]
MTVLKSFSGWRPQSDAIASQVAARPYDVLNTAEAKAESNEWSFLHISRSEIDLPADTNPYDSQVYALARKNFENFVAQKILTRDATPCLYVYALTMNGRTQTGICGLNSVADYEADLIKKHEFTRPEKEQDRINHMMATKLHSEPIFMAYQALPAIDAIVNQVTTAQPPAFSFTTADKIEHHLWVIDQPNTIKQLENLFATQVPAIYIADGHHRAASSVKVALQHKQLNAKHNGTEAYNYFLSVLFPDNQLQIMDYNRVIKDLNGLSPNEFLAQLDANFAVKKMTNSFKPSLKHMFGLYMNKQWYQLQAYPHTYNDKDPIAALDITLLSNYVLAPILGIKDQRTDKRIDFVGGIRGMAELQKRVDSGEMACAFSVPAVSIKQLIDIANTGQVMPPKSTWFEPKLRSGLVVHEF